MTKNKKDSLTNEEDEYAYLLANGMTQLQAYKESFKTNLSDYSIVSVASNLAQTKKIRDRVAEYSLLVTNKKVMDFNETCELLTEYARNKSDKTISLKAINQLVNISGWNAPTKVETKNDTKITGNIIEVSYKDAEAMKAMKQNNENS